MVIEIRREDIEVVILWMNRKHGLGFLILPVLTFLWAVSLRPNISVDAGQGIGTCSDCVAVFGVDPREVRNDITLDVAVVVDWNFRDCVVPWSWKASKRVKAAEIDCFTDQVEQG